MGSMARFRKTQEDVVMWPVQEVVVVRRGKFELKGDQGGLSPRAAPERL